MDQYREKGEPFIVFGKENIEKVKKIIVLFLKPDEKKGDIATIRCEQGKYPNTSEDFTKFYASNLQEKAIDGVTFSIQNTCLSNEYGISTFLVNDYPIMQYRDLPPSLKSGLSIGSRLDLAVRNQLRPQAIPNRGRGGN